MEESGFDQKRRSFRELMAGKSMAEIRAAKNSIENFSRMTPGQLQNFIDDLTLLESYKTKSHSCNEEFEKIMEKFYDGEIPQI